MNHAIARLRSPVLRSEANTSSSTASSRPAKAESPDSTRSSCSALVAPRTRDVVTIAPAFTIGFEARPVDSSMLMLLNGSPVGSVPIFASTSSCPRSARARA